MGTRRIIVPVLVAFALLTGVMPGAAQEEPTIADMDIEGLQKMYGRSFAADVMAMTDPASPEALPSGWWLLTTLVLEFDSEDTARTGIETIRNEVVSTSAPGGEAALEEIDLDLGGLAYSAHRAEDEQEGVTTSLVLVTVQDGRYAYAVVGLAFNQDPVPLVESVTLAMRDAGISDDEELFHEDGTSSGGLWAKLPTVAAITSWAPALTMVGDAVYFPPRDATPAA